MMSPVDSLLAVAAIWLIAVLTPGPNALYFTSVALSSGPRATAAAGAGVVAGTLLWGLAGLSGLIWLLDRFPAVALAVKLAGAAYLAFIGLRLLVRALRNTQGAEPAARGVQAGVPPRRAFVIALLTNLGNPKTLVFVSSVYAVSRLAEHPVSVGLAGVALMGAISSLYYLLFGYALRRAAGAARGGSAPWQRLAQGTIGLMMIGFGGKLAAG
jgi:threonine/homoserine/homoserine lactone efflux protein